MKSFVSVLKQCENAKGAGSKKVIQAALSQLSPTGRTLMNLALNPYVTFGVKKYNVPKVYADVDPETHELLFEGLEELAFRSLTGNAARDWVTRILEMYTQDTANYLMKIIAKNINAGFSPDTFNKVWPDDKIPVFDLMLADKCEDDEDIQNNVTFPCFGDLKLDGMRTIVLVNEKGVTYFSRSGLEAVECNGLFDDELMDLYQKYGADFVLDGERFGGSWAETANARKSTDTVAKNNLRLHVFFMMPMDDWLNKDTMITMKQNRVNLLERLSGYKKLIPSRGREVTSFSDMYNFLDEVTTPGFDGLPNGQEGLILKQYDAVYEWDRKLSWTKIKKFYDVDCQIVGFYEGKPKSRLEGTLGGIYVMGFLESGERVESKCGSGFSDELRNEIWNNKEEWLGKVVVIKYQEVSRAKNKEVASLRFCTFEHVRDDKLVEL